MKIFAYRRLSRSKHEIDHLNEGIDVLRATEDCWLACSQDLYNDDEYAVAFLGNIFNLDELKAKYGYDPSLNDFEYVLEAVKNGTFRNEEHEGSFCLIVYQKKDERFSVYVDPFGDLYPYYAVNSDFILISTHMTDFSDRKYFRLNHPWINEYFTGKYATGLQTVLKNVIRLRSGYFLRIEKNRANEHQFFDLYDRIRQQLSQPRLNVSVEEATDYFSKISTENLKSVFRKYKKPVLFLSQGVDSVGVLALMVQAGLPLLTMSRIPDNDYTEECLDIHARILKKAPHENHCHKIIGDRVFLELDKSYYIQPDNNTWQTLGINHQKSVVPSLKLGADCVISASMGDFIFLHRTKFFFFYWLSKNKDLIERPLGDLQSLFFKTFAGFENDYAYNPAELTERLLHSFRAAKGDFWRFFVDNLQILNGISHDRDNRLVGKINVIDPFKDTRLLNYFYLLPEDTMILSMRHSIFQEKMITRVLQERLYLQKKANPFGPGLVGYRFLNSLEPDLRRALKLLARLKVPTLQYYRDQFEIQKKRKSMDLVLCRVLTFSYWYQNWLKADRSPRGWLERARVLLNRLI